MHEKKLLDAIFSLKYFCGMKKTRTFAPDFRDETKKAR